MQNTITMWSIVTRWLHALIALSIITQLLLSQVLAPPDEFEDATDLAKAAMEGHEVIGLIVAGLLVIHWLWLFLRQSDVKLRNLFPLHLAGRQQVGADIRYALKNKLLPSAENHGGLSGLIHGVGILIASGVAFTGVGLYIVMDFTAKGFDSFLFEAVAEIHELFGNLMWFYLIAHVVAAAWHEYSGDHIIGRMFRLFK